MRPGRIRASTWGIMVSPHTSVRPVPWETAFPAVRPLEVEIGFGLGEFLLRTAQEEPGTNFVGIEEDWERIKKTLNRIQTAVQQSLHPADNIRILRIDARVAFERLFSPGSVRKVYALFPCPWPKKSHIRHRLFSREFLRLLNNRLSDGGEVQIVTDHGPYARWMEEEIPDSGFSAKMRTIAPRFDTKFERKWCAEGKKEFFEIVLKKTRHAEAPLLLDAPMKNYHFKQFAPSKFRFDDRTGGEVSVVLKDFLFDPDLQRGMFHFVVADKSMAQHVWMSLKKTPGGFTLGLADGHTVLPTAAVAEAMEHLAEAIGVCAV